MDVTTLAAAMKYTDKSIAGAGSITKGKNCTIQKIEPITGGNRVTFAWYFDDGTPQTSVMDVMNGAQGEPGQNGADGAPGQNGADGKDGKNGTPGRGIVSTTINNLNHLIITYSDGNTDDAGLLPVGQNGNNTYY